jgi:hypothetical protein
MPPYRTQDDVSCQQYHRFRPSPYLIPNDRVLGPSILAAGLDFVRSTTPNALRPNIPELSPMSNIDPLPYVVNAEDITAEPIRQTTARYSNPQVDDDYRASRTDEHQGDVAQPDSGPEDEYMVVLVRGAEGDSVQKLEVFFIPEREALQRQMNTLLAEGYRAASGSWSSDLQLTKIEVRRLDPSGYPLPRQVNESLGNGSPARSPTSSLTAIAAPAEDNIDTDSADIDPSADQMIMVLLEEDSLSESSAPSTTTRSTPTSHHEATDQVLEPEAEEGQDDLERDGFLIYSPTFGPSQFHSASAPSPARPRSTPPLMEGQPGSGLVGSASSSTSFQGDLATPHEKPSTSSVPAVDLTARESSSNPPARLQSSKARPPSSPTESFSQTGPVIAPSLGLALRPRHVVRRTQAVRSDSSEPPARFDDLPLWIDHFNTLSTLANGLKLRNPLPGDKVSQNQAFLSFRCLFIELFSFSAKGSMIGVPAVVSHPCKASRLGILADNTGS